MIRLSEKQWVGVVIVGITAVLVGLKTVAWLVTGSIAVQSEAFNSSVDLVYSLIIITGFLLSRREKTSTYPEGLVRLEPLVSLVVSGGIIGTGLWIAYSAIANIVTGTTETTVPILAIVALIITGVVKYLLYRFVSKKAEQYDSPSLAATAVDTRNDVLTTTTALIGVLFSFAGITIVEPIAALCIAGYITYAGARVLEENLHYALGRRVSQKLETEICDSVLSHENVYGVHDVEIHYTGPLIDVSLHAEIAGGVSIEEGHEIEIAIADSIRDSVDEQVNEINIHLDPASIDEWKSATSDHC